MDVIPFSPNIFNIFSRFDRDFICLLKLNRLYIFQFLSDPFEKIPEIYKQEMPRLAVTRFSATLKKMNVDLFLSRVVEVITLVLAHEKDTSSKLR